METLNKKATSKKNTLVTIFAILIFLALVTLGSIFIPYTSGLRMLITVIEKASVYALVAASMNLLNGFTGLFSLGQAGFMMIGAYAYAIFSIPASKHDSVYQYFDGGKIQWSLVEWLENILGGQGSFGGTIGHYLAMIILMIFAGIVAGIVAYLIGLPVLKLKSDYLAIATLGFAEILRAFFQWNNLGPITNGSNVLRKYTTYNNSVFPVIVAGVCVAIILLLINSSYGRAFKSIRDDEIAAEAMGINLFKHKEMSFVISSFFAGIGGALLAMFQTTIAATPFTSNMTYEILLIVVVGGIGSISGSVIGSFLFIALSEWWLRGLDAGKWLGITTDLFRSGFRKVVFAAIIIVIVLFFSQGIMGTKEFSWDNFKQGIKNLFSKEYHKKKRAQKLAVRLEKNEIKAMQEAAKAQAKKDKIDVGENVPGGRGLYEPLPVFDHVVVFAKEDK